MSVVIATRMAQNRIFLESPIMNASGPISKTYKMLLEIDDSKSAAVVSKSCTLEPREGNKQNVILHSDCSLNNNGLDNMGLDYYTATLLYKPYIISIAPTQKTIHAMLHMLRDKRNVNAVEINLSCPNTDDNNVIGYDAFHVAAMLKEIPKDYPKPIGIKLPPFYSRMHMDLIVQTICNFSDISFITAINTIGNAFVPNTNNVNGALGGKHLKFIALGNVRMLAKLLKLYGREDIDIVGCGGVFSGQDVFDMLMCGASAVQIGTCHLLEGAACFARIENEFRIIMVLHRYADIAQLKRHSIAASKL